MLQGNHREAEAAAATGAALQSRSEEAHRTALMAEADADLAHGEEGAAAREAERSTAASRLIHLTVDVMQVPMHLVLLLLNQCCRTRYTFGRFVIMQKMQNGQTQPGTQAENAIHSFSFKFRMLQIQIQITAIN